MACPTMVKLSAFVDGELPADERAVIERHLAACAPCREQVAAWRAALALLPELNGIPADDWLGARVRARAPRGSATPWSLAQKLALAAAAAAGLAVGGYLARGMFGGEGAAPSAYEFVASSAADLPGGSLGDMWTDMWGEGGGK